MRERRAALTAALLLAGAAGAFAAQPAAAPAVKPSTAAVASVATTYTADRVRDPFTRATSMAAGGGRAFNVEDFSIHNLSLRGIMKDGATEYALFSENTYGVSFILRKGKLYDSHGKAVPGVTGSISLRQKTAHLMTQESDVQVFRLGEENKD